MSLKCRKLLKISLCLFTVIAVAVLPVINVSAATYFAVGDILVIQNTTTYGELGLFYGNSTYKFIYASSDGSNTWPPILTNTTNFFMNWGFGISWYPATSRNFITPGTKVNISFTCNEALWRWFYNVKLSANLDPADFITVRCSSSSIGTDTTWESGRYYSQATVIEPSSIYVSSSAVQGDGVQPFFVTCSVMVPSESASFIFEFSVPSVEYSLSFDAYQPVKYSELIDNFTMSVVSIDPSIAKINNAITGADKTTTDLNDVSNQVDQIMGDIDGYTNSENAVAVIDPELVDINNLFGSSELLRLQVMVQEIWDSFGAEFLFVLNFSLVLGISIFLIGKKAKP